MTHGVAWFDLTVPQSAYCYGWHICCFEEEHEGDHLCIDGHTCGQEEESRHAS